MNQRKVKKENRSVGGGGGMRDRMQMNGHLL